jgi:hypothetical protein
MSAVSRSVNSAVSALQLRSLASTPGTMTRAKQESSCLLGGAAALVATAHKRARIVYAVITPSFTPKPNSAALPVP